MQNFSLLDVLSHFRYELRYCDSTYAVFQSEDHCVYVFNYNDKVMYIDNYLHEGDKHSLFASLSSDFSSDEAFEKHTFSVSFTDSITPEEIRKRIIALKAREEKHPHKFVQKTVFSSPPDGEDKIPLYRSGNLVNTLIVEGDALNASGGHSNLFKPQDPEHLNIYTSTAFIDDYYLNSHIETPFVFIFNPTDVRVYPGLESYITSFSAPSIVQSKDIIKDLHAFSHICKFYDSPYSFSIQEGANPVLIIHGSEKRDLRKFTNLIQRKLLQVKNQVKEASAYFSYAETEFYYYGFAAYIPLPKSSLLQQYLLAIIQEQLKLPIQISDLNSKVVEETIYSKVGVKPKTKAGRRRKTTTEIELQEDQLEDRLEDQLEDSYSKAKNHGSTNDGE